jgi:hypothetical protein
VLRITGKLEFDLDQSIFGCFDDVARRVKIDEARFSSLLSLPLVTCYANRFVFDVGVCAEYSHGEVQDIPLTAVILSLHVGSRRDDKAAPGQRVLAMETR